MNSKQLWCGVVVESSEEGNNEFVHLGVHVEHAIEVVHSQGEHPYEAGVDDLREVEEELVGFSVLEELGEAVLDDVAVLVMLELVENKVHEVGCGEEAEII